MSLVLAFVCIRSITHPVNAGRRFRSHGRRRPFKRMNLGSRGEIRRKAPPPTRWLRRHREVVGQIRAVATRLRHVIARTVAGVVRPALAEYPRSPRRLKSVASGTEQADHQRVATMAAAAEEMSSNVSSIQLGQ